MSYALVEDAKGDPRNAEFLGLASELAYLPRETGVPAFKERLGLEAVLFSVGNTQCYVAQNADHVVCAFRGTESPTSLDGFKDMFLTDAMNLMIIPEGQLGSDLAAAGVGARYHQGFVNALADIWEPVYTATSAHLKENDRPLWITGHSLGGALALLAGWMFLRRTINVHQIYTFGGPMIGNEEVAKAFNRELGGKIFRYVNTLDPVPQLPTLSLVSNQYTHCDTEIAPPAEGDEPSGLALLQSYASKAVDGLISGSLANDVWQAIRGRLEAHNLSSYYEMLKRLASR
jgi:triacylglycerol lipase